MRTEVYNDIDGVSPAHAGIDLDLGAVLRQMQGFPRPRGDRPDAERAAAAQEMFPPPTRG